jgi:hypothetical protein
VGPGKNSSIRPKRRPLISWQCFFCGLIYGRLAFSFSMRNVKNAEKAKAITVG